MNGGYLGMLVCEVRYGEMMDVVFVKLVVVVYWKVEILFGEKGMRW